MIWDKPELYQYDEVSELKKYLNPEWFNDMTIQDGKRLIIQFRNKHSDEKKEVIIKHKQNFDAAKKLLQQSKAL